MRRRWLKIALGLLLYGAPFPGASGAAAQSPHPVWAVNQITLPTTYEACVGLARLAMQAHEYKILTVLGGNTLAAKDKHMATISCVRAPEAKTTVNFIIASNGGSGAETYAQIELLRPEMLKPNCRATPWGFQFCHFGN